MDHNKETALAYEIADALNDRHSIDMHISFCKKFSESFLREKLSYVLARKNIDNPAGYYTSIMKRHDRNSRN